MKRTQFILMALMGILLISSCKKDDDMGPDNSEMKSITLDLSGLEDLGPDFVYEGWLIVNGSPVSTGTFTVDSDGMLSKKMFELNASDVDNASMFVLSIEPSNDSDPAPAATKILAGEFSGNIANIDISPVGDFSNVAGKYILATPTNGPDTDEKSGIWFLDLSTGMPTTGLMLPTLPEGWKYEGWTVINGKPVTTGKFTSVMATDKSAPFSGGEMLPDVNGSMGFFPGEDFLMNAPMGLSFPTEITGGIAAISVEPSPDNSEAPFALKPLVHNISESVMDHTTYNMNQNLEFPSGMVTR